MPTFQTPEPINLRVKLEAGDVRIDASERSDTVVELDSGDDELVQNTRVEQRNGTVVIEVPEKQRWFGTSEMSIRVALPAGSQVRVNTASADVEANGQLGNVEIHSASGDARLEHTADLSVNTASGDVHCRRVNGDAKVQSASGDISLPQVSGRAQVSTASGDVDLGEVHGPVRSNGASGDIQVEVAHGSVETKTASGDVRIGSVRSGSVTADAASGDITIGVSTGVAAWLDLTSLSGEVHSALDQSEQPGDNEDAVEIHARTLSGDISITRSI